MTLLFVLVPLRNWKLNGSVYRLLSFLSFWRKCIRELVEGFGLFGFAKVNLGLLEGKRVMLVGALNVGVSEIKGVILNLPRLSLRLRCYFRLK